MFIAGPYRADTHYEVADNIERARQAALKVRAKGIPVHHLDEDGVAKLYEELFR